MFQIHITDDVGAVEGRADLVSGDHHGYALEDPGPDHVADRCSPRPHDQKTKAPENQGRRNPKFKSKSKNQASSVIALGKDVGEIAPHGKTAIAAGATKPSKRGRHDRRR